ncbi:hypothetical protein [Methyloversatilis sp. RAC08]|uniref:hypothetical protein n=1 Tax=Methyloversatilis sp. RAC08 TaxID=1842540 RepID=UPI001CBB638F|nr:hypothetical protein [Methyloversatilis sp. RAC08]
MRPLRRCVAALILLGLHSSPQAAIELRFESLSAPAVELNDVRIAAAGLGGGRARITAARALVSGRALQHVRLECGDFAVLPEVRCRDGRLSADGYGPWSVEFSLGGPQRALRADVRLNADVTATITGALAGDAPQLRLVSSGVPMTYLLGKLPALKPYVPGGQVDVDATLTLAGAARSPRVRATLTARDGHFGSADGLRAADSLSAVIDIDVQRDGPDWRGKLVTDWRGGELLWDSVYLTGGGSVLSVDFRLSQSALDLTSLALDLAGIGRLTGDATLDRASASLRAARVQGAELDLKVLNDRFVQPLFAARGWPAFVMQGDADVAARLDPVGLHSAKLIVRGAHVNDMAGRYSLQQMDANLPWQRAGATRMRITVGEGRLGRVPVGRFELDVDAAPDNVAVQPVRIPLLDAGLQLNMLRFERADGRWTGDLSADLEPLSMPELTQALGWPRMAGSVGASVPHVRWRDGVLSLDGQLLIQVFGGYMAASGLQVIEPFGTTPRVLSDLQMRYIDLEALTETFKFGRITGRLDGDVSGLELSRWVPLAFDARVRSSEGDYPRTISQRAVDSITALGGPGATAAIQRTFLGVFERFGYRRIGVSCRLRNGVCEMDGLSDRNGGFVLIEGGGVPALSVVGYNRRVDWQVLLERLARVTETKPVIQ